MYYIFEVRIQRNIICSFSIDLVFEVMIQVRREAISLVVPQYALLTQNVFIFTVYEI